MTPDYSRLLDAALGASIRVEFGTDRRAVTNYSVVLVVDEGTGPQTVRVYDGTHRVNECTLTPAVEASSRRRSSTPVPLVRECVRQCARSRPPTKR